MFPILIPSKARSETCSSCYQLQQFNIPFLIFIYQEDYQDYLRFFSKDKLLVVPKNIRGLTPKRQYILDYAKQNNYSWFWMMDDDIEKLYKRPIENITKQKSLPLEPLNMKEFIQSIEIFVNCIENINPNHTIFEIGFKERAFGLQKHPISVNTDVGPIHLFNSKNIKKKYDLNMVALEDTDFSVQNIQSGKLNIKLNHFIFFAPKSGTNKGGLEKIYFESGKSKGVKQFQTKYPDLIKIDVNNPEKYRIKWSKFNHNQAEKDLTHIYEKCFY